MPGKGAEGGSELRIIEELHDQILFERMGDSDHWHAMRRRDQIQQG